MSNTDDLIRFGIMVGLFVEIFSCVLIDATIKPAVKRWLRSKEAPTNAVNSVVVLLFLLAPITVVVTGIYWVIWWLAHLVIAVRYLLPKRCWRGKSNLPTAIARESDKE